MDSIHCFSPNSKKDQPLCAESLATEAAWTTARCNRLLRPLSSKLALLRKARQLHQQLRSNEAPALKSKAPITSEAFPLGATSSTNASYHSSTKLTGKCQGWTPSPRPRKRIKRTYSSREVGHGLRREITESLVGLDENQPSLYNNDTSADQQFPAHYFSKRICLRSKSFDDELLPDEGITTSWREGVPMLQADSQILSRQPIKATQPDRCRLIKGLRSGLEALLKATANDGTKSNTGSRTLFSTCLRKTSEYIAAEELWCKREDPESVVDISSAVYNDLEAFGSFPNYGWKPLKEVVRAHGIALLGTAIKDRLITSIVICQWVRVCLDHGAYDEGEQLLECMITTMEPFEKPASVRSSFPESSNLGMLNYFASVSKRYGFQYRQLAKLFSSGVLPIEWMSTGNMIPCWNRAIHSIMEENGQAGEAAYLLRTTLSISYGLSNVSLCSQIHKIRVRADSSGITPSRSFLPGQAIHTPRPAKQKVLHRAGCGIEDMNHAFDSTRLHLLTILSTLVFVQKSAAASKSSEPRPPSLRILQDITLGFHQAIAIRSHDPSSDDFLHLPEEKGPKCLLLLAAGLIAARVDNDKVNLDPGENQDFALIRHLHPGHEFLRSGASFIRAVANCCGQAASYEAFQYLQELVRHLLQTDENHGQALESRHLFGKIAAAAAVQFSTATSLPRYISWALELESSVNRRSVGADFQTPLKPSMLAVTRTKSGFRWEEGICEWVAGTPMIPMPTPSLIGQASNAAPGMDGDTSPIVTLESSSIKPSPCLVEVPTKSIKFNSRAKSSEASPHPAVKSSYGAFFRVEINHSERREARIRQSCGKANPNTSGIGRGNTASRPRVNIAPSEQSPQKSSLETPKDSFHTLKQSAPQTKGGNSRRRKHKPCKPQVSCIFSEHEGRETSVACVGIRPEGLESEDELSFS